MGRYSYNYMPYIQRKSEKATFFSKKKSPLFFFLLCRSYIEQISVIKEQTIYRYYIEILKKEYDTEKASYS